MATKAQRIAFKRAQCVLKKSDDVGKAKARKICDVGKPIKGSKTKR